MRIRGLIFVLAFFILVVFEGVSSVRATTKDAIEVLSGADNWRVGGQLEEGDNLRFDVVLSKDVSGSKKKQSSYRVWSSRGDALVEMRDKKLYGQRVLMKPDVLWFFSPKSKRLVRVNPLQRLMGDASYGDISLTRFSIDYEVKWNDSPEGEWRDKEVYILELFAKNKRATYSRMLLMVDKESYKPLFLEAYVKSGKKIKGVEFGEIREINGRNMVGEMIFIDALNDDRKTIMEVKGVAEHKLDKKYHTKNGMRGRLPR